MNPSGSLLKTYVITLPEAATRRRFMEAQLANFPFMDPTFVSGVKGANLPPEELERSADAKRCLQTIGRALTPSEVGSTLSHLKVMGAIEKEGVSEALVLEDDALISGRLGGIIPGILGALPKDRPALILLTPCKYLRSRGRLIHPDFGVRPFVDGFYASGYVINRQAARVIPRTLVPLRAHIDWWKVTRQVADVQIDALVPYLVGISISENTVSYIDRGDRGPVTGRPPAGKKGAVQRWRELAHRVGQGVSERARGIRGQRLVF